MTPARSRTAVADALPSAWAGRPISSTARSSPGTPLEDLLDPRSSQADRAAASRHIDRAQTTSLTGLPLPRALVERLRRALRPAPGARLLDRLESDGLLPAPALQRLLAAAPGCEPVPRGPQRFETFDPLAHGESRNGVRVRIRQGRLGDCWLIAVAQACEAMRPGFLADRIRPVSFPGERARAPEPISAHALPALIRVRVAAPRVRLPLLRRIPFLPIETREVLLSTRVPTGHRAGDGRLRTAPVSLIEKAAALVWGDGSYGRLENDFAGVALLLLTGRWSLARPVPRTLDPFADWLAQLRPVVLSTLARPGGSFLLDREDGADGRIAVMDGHVYTALAVLRCDEDGRRRDDQPLRLHVRNPVAGRDSRRLRRTDLYLSAAQVRRAFISVNAGPSLDSGKGGTVRSD